MGIPRILTLLGPAANVDHLGIRGVNINHMPQIMPMEPWQRRSPMALSATAVAMLTMMGCHKALPMSQFNDFLLPPPLTYIIYPWMIRIATCDYVAQQSPAELSGRDGPSDPSVTYFKSHDHHPASLLQGFIPPGSVCWRTEHAEGVLLLGLH